MRPAIRAVLFLGLALVACGRSGSPTTPTVSRRGAEEPKPRVAPPTITSFTATPGSISLGQGVFLQWAVTDAASVTIDNGIGNVAQTGSILATPAALPATYQLTATDSGGSASKSVRIERHPPVFWALFAVPDNVLPGQSATLYWSTDADGVTIDNGIGDLTGGGGGVVISPVTYPATYQVTARNDAGSVSSTVTIELRPDPPDVEYRLFNYYGPECSRGGALFWEVTHDGFTENHNHPFYSFYSSIAHAESGQQLSLSAYCEPSSLGVSAMCVKTQIWKRGVLYVDGGNTCSAKGVF